MSSKEERWVYSSKGRTDPGHRKCSGCLSVRTHITHCHAGLRQRQPVCNTIPPSLLYIIHGGKRWWRKHRPCVDILHQRSLVTLILCCEDVQLSLQSCGRCRVLWCRAAHRRLWLEQSRYYSLTGMRKCTSWNLFVWKLPAEILNAVEGRRRFTVSHVHVVPKLEPQEAG